MKKFRGITKQQEFKPSETIRDLRPFWMQVRDLILGRTGSTVFVASLTAVMLIFPLVADIAFIFVLLVFWYSFFAMKELPFKMPLVVVK